VISESRLKDLSTRNDREGGFSVDLGPFCYWGSKPMTDLTKTSWRKSSYCTHGDCVEVALLEGEVVVRASKNPQGPMLHFTPIEWEAFLNGARHGEFDLAHSVRDE
jgi:hypothetical protein